MGRPKIAPGDRAELGAAWREAGRGVPLLLLGTDASWAEVLPRLCAIAVPPHRGPGFRDGA